MIQFEIYKKDFIEFFLNPIKKLNVSGTCSLYAENGKLMSLARTEDKSCVIYAQHTPKDITEDFSLIHISDVKRLILALKCIDQDEIRLSLETDRIFYDGKKFKFSSYLLDPKFATPIGIKPDKINSMEFDTHFSVSKERFGQIKIAQMIAPDACKLYFYSENDQMFVNLNDKSKSKIDNASLILSESYEGKGLIDPFVINGEVFKLITQFKEDVVFHLNTKIGVLVIEAQAEQYNLKYITSALVK